MSIGSDNKSRPILAVGLRFERGRPIVMKLLLDENLPHDLRHFIPGHEAA